MQKNLRRALCAATAGLCGIAIAPPSHADTLTAFDYRSLASKTDATDSLGNVWHHRAGLIGNDFSTLLSGASISGTTEPELYRSNAYGNVSYQIPVPAAATYKVTISMAEDFFHQSGQRVFDVSAEGTQELSNVDIYAAVGFGSALQKSFTVPVTDGTLNLAFTGVVNNPLVSAVEVTYSGAADTTTPANSTPIELTPTSSITQTDSTHTPALSPNAFWYQDVSSAPLASNSSTLTSSLVSQVNQWYGGIAAFNAYRYNVALYTASASQAKTDVTWVDCQNKGSVPENIYTGKAYFKQVPIPDNAQPANGQDGELSVYDPTTDQLWDFWQAQKVNGTWQACWGGRIDNASTSQGQFQEGYGASATNLSVSSGMVSIADVRRGYINHAISISIYNPAPFTEVSWPALRSDGGLNSGGVIREGQRLRLDPTLDLSKYNLTPVAKMIAVAAQKYGMIVTDQGGAVAVSAESGAQEQASTGTNPWGTLLNGGEDYLVMRYFPWDKMQFLPVDYGKP